MSSTWVIALFILSVDSHHFVCVHIFPESRISILHNFTMLSYIFDMFMNFVIIVDDSRQHRFFQTTHPDINKSSFRPKKHVFRLKNHVSAYFYCTFENTITVWRKNTSLRFGKDLLCKVFLRSILISRGHAYITLLKTL